MDFLQGGAPTGIVLVGIFKDPDYVIPRGRKELYNL